MIYHIDFETYSELDLKAFGAYRYAADPTTEILLCTIAEHWKAPLLWSINGQPEKPKALAMLKRMSEDPEAVLYAHNAQFEAAICHYLFEKTFNLPCPKIEQWRCTAAMCRRAAIPSALASASIFLKLDTLKDSKGYNLIKLFSVPQVPTKKQPLTRVLPKHEPEKFHDFGQYCKQDVIVEMQIHEKLKAFELKGEVLEAFQFDLRMNRRGVPVNVEALKITGELVDEFDSKITKSFREITDLNLAQTAKVLEWLRERGYPAKNLQSATVDGVIDDGPGGYGMTDEAFEALKLKRLSGFAALKKIPTMLGAACPEDGRVKGSLLWSGAERTHRWSGKIIQPQNFRRPTIKNSEHLYTTLKTGNMDVASLEAIFESPLEAIASCIRHFIEPVPVETRFDCVHTTETPGRFLNADYAAIEARIVLWLAGQEDGLELFRQKKDTYVTMASKIFGVPPEEITKDQRFVGKQAVLLCGFQGGDDKFRSTCQGYGRTLSQELCKTTIKTYRAVNYKVVSMWEACNEAAKEAIRNPNKVVKANDKIKFMMSNKPGFPALIMQLPSGHNLIYPYPQVKPAVKTYKGETYTTDEVSFIGLKGGRPLRMGTYGGSLVENATQAVAGDIMSNGALKAEKAGYDIFMLVHDEALAEDKPGHTIEAFCEALCDLPDWAEGLPIEAEGSFIRFYTKD